ncbi:MAG: ABC transporter permease, partial [Terriglobales bacterium]
MIRWLRKLGMGLWALARRREQERDLEAELDSYATCAAEAGRYAWRGSREAVREQVRAAGWEHWIEVGWRDLRYAARGVRRSPGTAVMIVLTLALGIGANSALFSWVYATAWRPLPYAHAKQLAWVTTEFKQRGIVGAGTSGAALRDWEPRLRELFDQHAIVGGNQDATWRSGEEGLQLTSRSVGGNFFRLLGVQAYAGRLLTPEDAEAGQGAVAVLSYDFWRREFSGDRGILGKTMSERGGDFPVYTIVGVLPPEFQWEATAD